MPTITGVSPQAFGDGRSVTVTGSGFGASGTVTIGGVTQNIVSWSDDTVVFTAVRGTQGMGPARVDVVKGSAGNSAVLAGSVMTISGTGFGTKPAAAPFYWQDFSALADGSTAAAAGLKWSTDTAQTPDTSEVISTDGVGIQKALRMTAATASQATDSGFSPYLEVNTSSASSTGLRLSFWYKIIQTTSGTASSYVQHKAPRSGVFGSSPTDPTSNYQTSVKINSQAYYNASSQTSATMGQMWTDYLPQATDNYGTSAPGNFLSTWNHWDSYRQFNDVGSSDGVCIETVNGQVIQYITTIANRSSSGQIMDFIHVWAGLQFTRQKDWDIRLARIMIDTTRAQVFLGNASSVTECTGRYVLKPTSWSDTQIVCGAASNIPSGYDWVYVEKTDGTILPAIGYV